LKHAIWISFDFGVSGDYEGLYTWLDKHNAKECGNNIAFLQYEYSRSPVEDLKKELNAAVKIGANSRIYVIYKDQETNKQRGSFVVGGRKAAPWSGYAGSVEEIDADETDDVSQTPPFDESQTRARGKARRSP
jgi:hypothetical protein